MMDFAHISISRKIQVHQKLVEVFSMCICVYITTGKREFALTVT